MTNISTTDLIGEIRHRAEAQPAQGARQMLRVVRQGDSPLLIERRSIESILKNGLDREPLSPATAPSPPPEHANLRGSEYYH